MDNHRPAPGDGEAIGLANRRAHASKLQVYFAVTCNSGLDMDSLLDPLDVAEVFSIRDDG